MDLVLRRDQFFWSNVNRLIELDPRFRALDVGVDQENCLTGIVMREVRHERHLHRLLLTACERQTPEC